MYVSLSVFKVLVQVFLSFSKCFKLFNIFMARTSVYKFKDKFFEFLGKL